MRVGLTDSIGKLDRFRQFIHQQVSIGNDVLFPHAPNHLFGAIQFLLYLHFQPLAAKLKGLGAETPIRLCPLAEVTLSQHLSSALRFILAKPLILCIEDDPMHLTLRKKVLERDGYRVIGVTTAADALKTLREAPVCATISDHLLQGTTGTQLAVQMKKIKPDVPIILFSGTVPERFDAFDVFINKGEPTPEFLRIVREVVERFIS